MNEIQFKKKFKDKIRKLIGQGKCLMYENSPLVKPGFPDFTLIFDRVVMFIEMKKSSDAYISEQQRYYQKKLNELHQNAYVVSPENENDILEVIKKYLHEDI